MSDDESQNWCVGKGVGGVPDTFGWWNLTFNRLVGNISDFHFWHQSRIDIGDHIFLWCDEEGGNIEIKGNDGTYWQLDTLGGQMRFVLNGTSVPIAFKQDGSIDTYKGTIITTNMVTVSGNELIFEWL